MAKEKDLDIIDSNGTAIETGRVLDRKELGAIILEQAEKLTAFEKSLAKTQKKADEAYDSANTAAHKSTKLGKHKAAIESLQSAAVDLAEAQVSAADTQKISFEYQKNLTDMSEYLLKLGNSSLTNNRNLVKELEKYLESASSAKLSEYGRAELLKVTKEIKSQEDILIRQDHTAKKVKEHDEFLREQSEREREYAERIKQHEEKDAEQDKRLKIKEKKDKEQDKQLKIGEEKDAEHDRLLAIGEGKDAEHDRLLAIGEEKDRIHDEQIRMLTEKIKELQHELAVLKRNSRIR